MKQLTFLLFLSTVIVSTYAQKIKISELSKVPEPVTNNAVVEGFIDGKAYLYTFGGLDSTKLYSGIHQRSYRYDISNNQWEKIQSLPDTLGKIASAASRVKDIIYIIGGYHVFEDHHEVSSNKVHRFDIKANKFLTDGDTVPLPIDDHVQAVWNDSLIYVITGWSNKGNVANVQFYNPGKNKWTVATPVPDTEEFKVFGGAGNIIGNTIYYYGGAKYAKNYPGQSILRKGEIDPNNPSNIKWQKIEIKEKEVLYRAISIVQENNILWMGGSNITYNYNGIAYNGSGGVPIASSMLIYDSKKQSWRKSRKNLAPMDLRGIGIINDQTAYLIGGMLEKQKVSNILYKIEIR